MERAAVRLTLFGLLLAFAASLPTKDDWDIYSFHINSTVTSRYATTTITSRVANRMEESKEIEFHVQIPKNAFISRFRMFIDGQVYDGVVKTKEQAQQQYSEAVSRGQSAGIVSSVGRTMEEFKTSVTVAAHKKVTFELTYEELLKRTRGKYELQIHARPMQPVTDFKVDVYINEKAGISYIDVKGGLSTKALGNAVTRTHADKQAWVHFYPTVEQQKTCDSCGEQGMNGDLVIVYDVNRDSGLGDIRTSDGYFVHHFAPSSLPRIPKNIVFLIDRSGSMHGIKMEQTRTALIHILSDLAEDDFFGLITFDSHISHWKRELVQATSANLEGAKQFSQNIQDGGATNINEAVLQGARMLNAHPREGSASILILLTDGDPTTGETNTEAIQSNVRKAVAGKFPLYCLGFGFDVKFEFLEKMSLENNGVARRIYQDSDADLQLKGFYEEVATPLLTDVIMLYVGGANVTQTNFSQYYNGSEIVVAGQITDNDIETFTPQVVAVSSKRKVTFSNTNTSVEPSSGTVAEGLLQRVWAYLTVKQLLQKELLLSGPEKDKVKKEALELSLKYSFVTPLTSMVVTKPQTNNTEVLHKPKEGEGSVQTQARGGTHMSRGSSYHHRFFSRPTKLRKRPRIHYGGSAIYGLRPLPAPPAPPAPPGPPGPPGLPGRHGEHGRIGFLTPRYNGGFFDADYLGGPDHDSSIAHARAVDFDDHFMMSTPIQRTTTAPTYHRLLLKAENQPRPICFEVSGSPVLKLLHHPSRELYMNGELNSETNGGFKKIVIQVRNDLHVEIDPEGVTLRNTQSNTCQTGEDFMTTGSVTVIRRDKEVDVAAEDMRVVILVHEKNGNKFLWPVLRQRPSADNTEGILVLKSADFEELQQHHGTKLKIKDSEVDATSVSASDYSFPSPLGIQCWLIPPDAALQRPLQDFITTQTNIQPC